MNRWDIACLQFLLEGYEGVCSVSTIDPRIALLQISAMPGFEDTVSEILCRLKTEIEFHEPLLPGN
ncbi:DUF4911 domain-containing protein [Syntrophus sp. (in: bacteria)]|uniref:DUF4911 domain-containing protein n=1 Tax=Syntrophus sp. (in: bacteria) TaxID=48412 RepID=UPI00345EA0B6